MAGGFFKGLVTKFTPKIAASKVPGQSSSGQRLTPDRVPDSWKQKIGGLKGRPPLK